MDLDLKKVRHEFALKATCKETQCALYCSSWTPKATAVPWTWLQFGRSCTKWLAAALPLSTQHWACSQTDLVVNSSKEFTIATRIVCFIETSSPKTCSSTAEANSNSPILVSPEPSAFPSTPSQTRSSPSGTAHQMSCLGHGRTPPPSTFGAQAASWPR